MDTKTLKATLAQLQRELESGGPLDPQLKQLLANLDLDIQAVLARNEASDEAPSGGVDEDAQTDLTEQVQAIEARFAVEYPNLSTALRSVMDTLGKMGI